MTDTIKELPRNISGNEIWSDSLVNSVLPVRYPLKLSLHLNQYGTGTWTKVPGSIPGLNETFSSTTLSAASNPDVK